LPGPDRKGTGDCADEVTLSRKGTKSRTQGRNLRSTGTKARTRVGPIRESRAELYQQLKACRRELAEAQDQQRATSEVPGIISSSPSDLGPVFHAMLVNAVHVCAAQFGSLALCDGDLLRVVARFNQPPELIAALGTLDAGAYRVDRRTAIARAVRTKQVVHIADIKTEPSSHLDEPLRAVYAKHGLRTVLAVPLLKENAVLGVIAMYRLEVRPFTDRQIELVKNFAAQAVIAIENTRLLNELRQRTDDLSEALEQQTATSEVLGIISSSPGELEPVFKAMLANATRLCEAKFGNLQLYEGDAFRTVAFHNAPPEFVAERKRAPIRPGPNTGLGRVARTKQVVHIPDLMADSAYADRDPIRLQAVEVLRARTYLAVPMLKENESGADAGPAAMFVNKEPRVFGDPMQVLAQGVAQQPANP